MTCWRVRRRLRLSEAVAAEPRIEDHLATCRACRAYAREIEQLRTTLSAFAREDEVEDATDLVRRVAFRLSATEQAPRGFSVWLGEVERRPFPSLLGAALVLWLALAGTFQFPFVEPALHQLLGF